MSEDNPTFKKIKKKVVGDVTARKLKVSELLKKLHQDGTFASIDLSKDTIRVAGTATQTSASRAEQRWRENVDDMLSYPNAAFEDEYPRFHADLRDARTRGEVSRSFYAQASIRLAEHRAQIQTTMFSRSRKPLNEQTDAFTTLYVRRADNCLRCAKSIVVGSQAGWRPRGGGIVCRACYDVIQQVQHTAAAATAAAARARQPAPSPSAAHSHVQGIKPDTVMWGGKWLFRQKPKPEVVPPGERVMVVTAGPYTGYYFTEPGPVVPPSPPVPTPEPVTLSSASSADMKALLALETAVVEKAGKQLTVAMEKDWNRYKKLKAMALSPANTNEGKIALRRALITLIELVYG